MGGDMEGGSGHDSPVGVLVDEGFTEDERGLGGNGPSPM